MRFSHITIALCAALLSPGSTLGHEDHSHDHSHNHSHDVTDLTTTDGNSSASPESWVYEDDSAEHTSLSPEFPLPVDPSVTAGSALPLPITHVHIHNHSSILDTIVGSSTRGVGFNDSGSMAGFATYTATPSTEVNRTSNITKPTMSVLPADTSDTTVLTTRVFGALVAFIFALVAVEM